MTDSPVGDMIGLAVGVGFGLAALNIIDRAQERREEHPKKKQTQRRKDEDDFFPDIF